MSNSSATQQAPTFNPQVTTTVVQPTPPTLEQLTAKVSNLDTVLSSLIEKLDKVLSGNNTNNNATKSVGGDGPLAQLQQDQDKMAVVQVQQQQQQVSPKAVMKMIRSYCASISDGFNVIVQSCKDSGFEVGAQDTTKVVMELLGTLQLDLYCYELSEIVCRHLYASYIYHKEGDKYDAVAPVVRGVYDLIAAIYQFMNTYKVTMHDALHKCLYGTAQVATHILISEYDILVGLNGQPRCMW